MLNRIKARWLTPALLVVAAFVGFAPSAKATWSYEQLRWRHFGRGDIGFSENGPVTPTSNPVSPRGSDTLYVSGAAARVDTSTAFNMLDSEPSPTGAVSIGGSTADSSQVGAVILAADSTVLSTLAWAATICQFQVNYGQNSTGWTSVGSTISPLGTTTQKALVFPMWQLPVTTAHLGSTTFNSTYNIFAPQVRVLITWGTAAAVPSARLYVRKWVGTGSINIPNGEVTQGNK
jgi:hypothetical protein